MQAVILVIIVGLIGGVAIGLQNPLASLLTQRIGILESIFIVHMGGAIAISVPLLLRRGGNLGDWQRAPWYAWGAGFLGLAVIGAISFSIPRLGVATTIFLLVVGQLIIATVLDQFGLLGVSVRPMNISRILGILVLIVGVWLMVRD